MLYLLLAIGIILICLSVLACRLALDALNELARQREAIEHIRQTLDGHWKGANYMHAQTRALIQGEPPPNKKDYWN